MSVSPPRTDMLNVRINVGNVPLADLAIDRHVRPDGLAVPRGESAAGDCSGAAVPLLIGAGAVNCFDRNLNLNEDSPEIFRAGSLIGSG